MTTLVAPLVPPTLKPRPTPGMARKPWRFLARSLGAGKNPSDCLKVAEVGVMPKKAPTFGTIQDVRHW